MARPVCKWLFEDVNWSVCVNVSGVRLVAAAKMEIRAPWAS
jgi:hypothetical protein